MSFHFNLSRTSSLAGLQGGAVPHVYRVVDGCEDTEADAQADPKGRMRLHQLNGHLHCSIIGTCLSTGELRKLVGKIGKVGQGDAARGSDLEVHHEAVSLAGDKLAGKALTKALDKRHEAVIQSFSKARDAEALAGLWREALRSGAIPGAYWALMSHRQATPELRQQAFGEVHMLSHLVGAANRADIRRLCALEQDNADLRERVDRQQERITELAEARARQQRACERRDLEASVAAEAQPSADAAGLAAELAALRAELQAQTQLVALQARRRELAEQALAAAEAEQALLQAEADRSRRLNETLTRELGSAEVQLQARLQAEPGEGRASALGEAMRGWKILYVGGRPSSTPAIRKLVGECGAEFIHHDGGMEDRKGLLAGALAGASIVAFPVDCIDHDSVANLKRLCARHGVPFLALRTASVTCFAASMAAAVATTSPISDTAARPAAPICLRHG